MTNNISLTASMRSNLLSLQNISRQVSSTQNKLATGNKVNSAIDNPSSYYTARSLNNRANDLDALLDSMGQAVSTIKAATTALETGISFIEQMTSIAEQALEQPMQVGENIVPSGYIAITSSMSADEINALITDGAKLILTSDITLDKGLKITAQNVVIDGNGHTLNLIPVAEREAAIFVDGANAEVNVQNLNIKAVGNRTYGIRAAHGATLNIDNTAGIKVSGVGARRIVNGSADLFNGQSNTWAIIDQIGKEGLDAYATTQYYVPGLDKNDTNFGQGKWYMPSMGELIQAHGYNADEMTSGRNAGGTGINSKKINATLKLLSKKNLDIDEYSGGYSSSSEYNNSTHWALNSSSYAKVPTGKTGGYKVRPFSYVDGVYNPLSNSRPAPQIGDIMYADKTYGSAADYDPDSGKTIVGVITDVSADGADVTIMGLKDLTFSSVSNVDNFNPDDPYGNSNIQPRWATSAEHYTDITDIPNFDEEAFAAEFKIGGTINIANQVITTKINPSYVSRFNDIRSQYDSLLADSSYKGINLLKGDGLTVNFNEDRSSNYQFKGKDVSAANIGITEVEWISAADVAATLQDIKVAVVELRNYAAELGNSYSIIQTRQDFTDSLINVLTEGADKLTLADMNEESANMLALQTRQQLAINSLSLASQANQAVLKLF